MLEDTAGIRRVVLACGTVDLSLALYFTVRLPKSGILNALTLKSNRKIKKVCVK